MPMKRMVDMQKSRKWLWFSLFLFPVVFIFLTVVVAPFFLGIYYSFFDWDGMSLNAKIPVGFQNYVRVFSDAGFWSASSKTLLFTLIAVVLINVLGFTFANIVTSRLRARNLARAMLFMPYLIGGLILGYIWKFIFEDGFVALGKATGLTSVFFDWVNSPQMALYALIIVAAWQMAGYIMIIYITGLQSIPDEFIEAASVDGATGWQTMFKIKVPLLMPSFTVCLFMTLANCFKMYDINLSLTKGGPANASELVAMNIYNEIFSKSNFGYGQAKAILFFFVIAIVTMVQVYITKKREVTL